MLSKSTPYFQTFLFTIVRHISEQTILCTQSEKTNVWKETHNRPKASRELGLQFNPNCIHTVLKMNTDRLLNKPYVNEVTSTEHNLY